MYFTSTHLGGSVSSQVFHCFSLKCLWIILGFPLSLGWLWIVPSVPLRLLGWIWVNSDMSLLLTAVALCHPWCFKVAHKGNFASYQYLIATHWRDYVIPGLWLKITEVDFHSSRCFTTSRKVWLCVFPDVPLHLTVVTLHHPMPSTVASFGGFVSSQASY